MTLPLEGIRVLDLSRVLAGPLVAQMLGDLGAEVIKIEKPGDGDDSRSYGPPFLHDTAGARTRESGFYLSANRNKRSLTVNLGSESGQEVVRAIAKQSDVVIENFRVGTLAKFGLDYDSLSKLNPRLVYLSITGYGQTGRMAHRPGYDAIFQAAGGHMAVSGAPDNLPGGGPTRSGLSIVDILTSHYGVTAVLAALSHRDRSPEGKGQYIDIALLDSMVATLSHRGMQYLISGKISPRRGNVGGGGSPSQAFHCSDGQLVLTVGNNTQWLRFCDAIGEPQLANDERFAAPTSRIENRELLTPLLEEKFMSNTKAYWLDALEKADIPSGPVNELDEVFRDEQILSRGMLKSVKHPESADLPLISNPIQFSETPLDRYEAPPTLGEHTDMVLKDILGYTDDQIESLKASGAV
ncbi:CoA transferase [Parahaliea maris]|uniref:CoA transferase n=1 Tax=Parahaliea maris TaxID=2716870 RepID=A0A5C8ZTR5_9GAMM|nr:CaiB/BaiF CoA-transferase family protein [Parahaliea maris]TXS91888.1 CoA transferase [Parahaliea maris]